MYVADRPLYLYKPVTSGFYAQFFKYSSGNQFNIISHTPDAKNLVKILKLSALFLGHINLEEILDGYEKN